ncbi:putative F-box protein [Cinnamomum micranthum f. kanehirae]|uniref:Putative F-box protein n=1 Tax=Cinnamomum micranthum f. kanehirae TaxID=337451 RepID=A0A443PCB4_9MAGN|nr:putative F-box protein [Cinnamomum micranthum f. kanehirae]
MEVDRLSSLPDHLIHHILSFFDTKHVILLGVLSSRWRDLSTSVPNLHFNYSLDFDDEDYFVRFVDRALLVNSSPNIHKFQLSWLPYNKEYVSHVDAWLRFAMRKGIQQLDFSFPCIYDSYELPSWFLNCETLVSLTLRNCWIGVSKLVNFTNLTVLYLHYVKLRVGFVEDLLKGCPLLEELTICSSSFVHVKICTSSSLQLKRLKIKGGYTLRVNVEAPNLQVLKFSSGTFGKFSFKAMPFLREAEVSISYDPDMRKKCIPSLKSSLLNLRNARVLKLCSTCIQTMPIPTFEDLHSCFFKTKVLVLRTGVQKFEMPGIANLLWSSPDLENLIIDLGRYDCIYEDKDCMLKYDFDEREYWESLTATFPCLVHHLKTIKITGFLGEGSRIKVTSFHEKDEQIKLVKFLLKNAMVLEKMIIHVCDRPKFVKVEQWPEILLGVAQKLVAFPRASSRAEVTFSYK